MAKNKTVANNEDVENFLSNIENDQKRNDAFELLKLMKDITKEIPKMWGKSIVGFGGGTIKTTLSPLCFKLLIEPMKY